MPRYRRAGGDLHEQHQRQRRRSLGVVFQALASQGFTRRTPQPEKSDTFRVTSVIPCTSAVRTIIDIAPDVCAGELDHMIQAALARRLFTPDELRAMLGG